MSLQARETKAKINKWDYKPKNFCTMKATTNKIERPPIEWEKILASDTYDNRLISNICKELI